MGFLGSRRASGATRIAALLLLLSIATSGLGLAAAGGAAASAPAPGLAQDGGGPPTLTGADAGRGIQSLPEFFVSPLTGTLYRILKDADSGAKTYCGPDGACTSSTDAILSREAQDLPPWARAVAPSLRSRAGADGTVNVIVELKDSTFARVASGVWARVSDPLLAAEEHVLAAESTGSRAPRTDLEALDAIADSAKAEVYATAMQELGPLVAGVRGHVEALGGEFQGYTPVLPAVFARLPLSALPAFALDPAVLWVSEDLPVRAQMDVSAFAIHADTYWTNGFTGGVWDAAVEDTGNDRTHPAMPAGPDAVFHAAGQGDACYGDQPTNPDDLHSHGTHVAGTVASQDATYRGVAYGLNALINAKAGWLVNASCGGGGAMYPADGMNGVDWAIATAGADVISLSFGGGPAGDTPWERFFDAVVDDLGVAVAIAAGNSGPGASSVGEPGAGFNILSVGAINDQGTITRADDGIIWFSSRGPTLDGRLKPDVSAPGVNIRSTNAFWEGGGADFVDMSGTSMATPHIAASLILLMDGSGTSLPLRMKALLLNSAQDMGAGGGDTDYGWGYEDLGQAYATRPFVTDGLVGTGAVHYTFYRGRAVPGDKATLVWNRHATYLAGRTPTVYYGLNDLDLFGYDEANNARLASSTRTVDNVEQVVASGNIASYVYKVHAPGSFVGVAQEQYGLAFTESAAAVTPPSLSVPITVPPSEELGNTFTVTATVTNGGELAAHNVAATLSLPPGLRLVSGANPQGLGRIASGGSAVASWQVLAEATATYSVTVDATSNSYDEVFAANSGPQSIIVLDTTAPSSSVDALPVNTTTASFGATASASDLGGVSNVELWFRRNGGAWTNFGPDGASPWLWTFDTTAAGGDGLYEFYSVATDRSANREGAPAAPDASTLVDTSAPASIVDALPTYTTTSTLTVTANASDLGVGVTNVSLYYRRSAGPWTLLGLATGAPWSWAVNTSSLGGDGLYEFYSVATDLFGNAEVKAPVVEASTTVDTAPPSSSSSLSGVMGGNGWYTTFVTVTITAFDALSGWNATTYRVDGGAWQTYGTPFQVPAEGAHSVEFGSTDRAGNTEPVQRTDFRVDTQRPATTYVLSGTLGTNGWYTSVLTVTLAGVDNTSGVNDTQVQVDGGTWQTYATPFAIAGDGSHTFVFFSTDVAGNVEPVQRVDLRLDTTLPVSVANRVGTQGGGGWYTSAVTVSLSATDNGTGSGLATRQYRVDGGTWRTYTAAFPLSTDGPHAVDYFATDLAGNAEAPKSTAFRIDTAPPVIAITSPAEGSTLRASSVTMTWSASDNMSGLNGCYLALDLGPVIPVANATSYTFNDLSDGGHRASVACTDVAGNTDSREVALTVDTRAPSILDTLFTWPGLGLLILIPAVIVLALIAVGLRRRRKEKEVAARRAVAPRGAPRPLPPPPPPPEDEPPSSFWPPPPPD